MAEVDAFAPKLADAIFGSNEFADAKRMSKPEYMKHIRWCFVNGATVDGMWLAAPAWSLKMIERIGERQFLDDVAEAFDLPKPKITPNDIGLMRMALQQGGVVEDWNANSLEMMMAQPPQIDQEGVG